MSVFFRAVFFLMTIAVARADTINFTPGFAYSTTSVTYQGVTFTSIVNGSSGGLGIEANRSWASYFSNIPGDSLGNALDDRQGRTNLTMNFAAPVRNVSMLLSTGMVTTWTLSAFGSSANLLGETTVTMPGSRQAVMATLSLSGIFQVRISEATDNGNITLIDDIKFTPDTGMHPTTSTPEPSSLFLLSGGLIGSAKALQRRASRVSFSAGFKNTSKEKGRPCGRPLT